MVGCITLGNCSIRASERTMSQLNKNLYNLERCESVKKINSAYAGYSWSIVNKQFFNITGKQRECLKHK